LYTVTIKSQILWHSTWKQNRSVTVDLTTGRALRAADIFTTAALTPAGVRTFMARANPRIRGGSLCPGESGGAVTAAAFGNGGVSVALDHRQLTAILDAPAMGYTTACGTHEVSIPYPEVTALLRPEVLKSVPYP